MHLLIEALIWVNICKQKSMSGLSQVQEVESKSIHIDLLHSCGIDVWSMSIRCVFLTGVIRHSLKKLPKIFPVTYTGLQKKNVLGFTGFHYLAWSFQNVQPNYGSINKWHTNCILLSTPEISIYTIYANAVVNLLLFEETPAAYLIKMTSSNGNISALLAICAGNSPVPGEFPAQRPVTRSFDVFFDLNKRLSRQSWGWCFETLLRPLWRHCNVKDVNPSSAKQPLKFNGCLAELGLASTEKHYCQIWKSLPWRPRLYHGIMVAR